MVLHHKIPFQMCAYRLAEKEKTILNTMDKNGELAIEAASTCKDENNSMVEDPVIAASDTKLVASDVKSICSVCSDIRSIDSEIPEKRSINFDTPLKRSISTKIPEKILLMKRNTNVKSKKSSGTTNGQSTRPPTLNRGHSVRIIRECRSPLITSSLSRGRQRVAAGHTSD